MTAAASSVKTPDPSGDGAAIRGMDPRMSPKQVGVVLALASEVMFFTGLFAAWFFLEAETVEWPPAGIDPDPVLPAVATVLIVLAAVAAKVGQARLVTGGSGGVADLGSGPPGLSSGAGGAVAFAVTGGLGLAYCVVTIADWVTVGFSIGDNAYASLYFAMTGLHMIHVLAGVVALGVLWHSWESAQTPDTADARIAAYFWYWIAALWVAMFGVVFVIG